MVVHVAVVGSGLAGLTAAHTLASDPRLNATVHIFEKNPRLGLDCASVKVSDSTVVDTPMRSLQSGYYPHTLRLYRELGIPLARHNYSYSFARSSSSQPYLLYAGSNALSFPPVSLPAALLAAPSCNATSYVQYIFYILSIALAYFYLLLATCVSLFILPRAWLNELSMDEWCHLVHLPDTFIDDILYPLFSCVCTCSVQHVGDYPAVDILQYIIKTFGQDHLTVKGGVSTVATRLIAPIPTSQIHLNTSIISLAQNTDTDKDTTHRRTRLHSETGEYWDFDHVILATPSLQAAEMLASLTSTSDPRYQLINSLLTTASLVVNHTDSSISPLSAQDVRDLNILCSSPPPLFDENEDEDSPPLTPEPSHSPGLLSPIQDDMRVCGNGQISLDNAHKDHQHKHLYVQATHVIHTTKDDYAKMTSPAATIYQTTNPITMIDKDKVISTSWFSRARATVNSRKIVQILDDLQGQDGIWFVGAWSVPGIPLLESCVKSAHNVTRNGILPYELGNGNYLDQLL